MNVFLILFFFIFFLYTFIIIFNKTYILGFVYFLLFIYTFFTMIGYNLYPQKTAIYSLGQYYGNEIFMKYYLYIFLGFLLIYILFKVLYNHKFGIRIGFKKVDKNKKINTLFFLTIIIFCIGIQIFFLRENYNALSYYNQYILKNNKLWSYLFSFDGIILLLISARFLHVNSKLRKGFLGVLFILISTVFFLTSVKAGQRIEIFCLFLSIIIIFLSKNKFKIRVKNFKKMIRLLLLILVFVGISQVIRNNRGDVVNISNIKLNSDSFLSLLDFENIVFQDYLSPSLTLMTSMKYKFIFPIEIFKGNFLNSLIVFDYPSAGEKISRFLSPNSWTGVGYYFFTEGYNVMGFAGFLYSSVLLVFVYYLYESILVNTNEEDFNIFISGVIAYYMINIVRGGTLFFIKGILFYIIPFLVLYCIATNKKIIFLVKK